MLATLRFSGLLLYVLMLYLVHKMGKQDGWDKVIYQNQYSWSLNLNLACTYLGYLQPISCIDIKIVDGYSIRLF